MLKIILKATLSSVLLYATSPAIAGDLPTKSVVLKKSDHVEIQKILDVKITGQSNLQGELSGVLQLTLQVEGNICDNDPDTLAFQLERLDRKNMAVKLFVSREYQPEPDILRGCLLYSRYSNVVVPIELQNFSMTYVVAQEYTVELFLRGQRSLKKIAVSVANEQFVFEVLEI